MLVYTRKVAQFKEQALETVTVRRTEKIAEIGLFLPKNEEMLHGLHHTLGPSFIPRIHTANFSFLYTHNILITLESFFSLIYM